MVSSQLLSFASGTTSHSELYMITNPCDLPILPVRCKYSYFRHQCSSRSAPLAHMERLRPENIAWISTKAALGSTACGFCPCTCSQRAKLHHHHESQDSTSLWRQQNNILSSGSWDSECTVRHKELMSCPYIFPSTSRCPGDYIQEGVCQVAITVEGVVSTTKRDVAEIPANGWWQKEKAGGK